MGNFGNFVDLIIMSSPTVTSFYLTSGLVTGNKYRFRVIAQNSVRFGPPSNYVQVMPASLPGSPSTPYLTALASSSIQISWTFNNSMNGGTPISDYAVYWDQGILGNKAVASSSTGLWNSFTTLPGTVSAGITYNFWVSARNYIGLGSNSTKFTVLAG